MSEQLNNLLDIQTRVAMAIAESGFVPLDLELELIEAEQGVEA